MKKDVQEITVNFNLMQNLKQNGVEKMKRCITSREKYFIQQKLISTKSSQTLKTNGIQAA